MDEYSTYTCDSCGELVQLALDISGGPLQQYVEDCPVCCCPILLRISWDSEGQARVEASLE